MAETGSSKVGIRPPVRVGGEELQSPDDMNSFRFIHAADLHLDCQLKGLEQYEGAPVQKLRDAPRRALENLIDLAIAEQVAFVVIAGDLFDGKWTDIQTGLWTSQQFQRLARHQIRVYLIRGNHDAMAESPVRMTWPSNVHEFPTDRPATEIDPRSGAAIHGQGFAQRECSVDLARNYPAADPQRFNLGILHTSLMGDAQHDVYAPTTPDVLTGKRYDYWALGHIHAYRIVSESPWIVYPGCAQARHIREQGAKGCLLVSVENHSCRLEFRELDVLRWQSATAELAPTDKRREMLEAVQTQLEACRDRAEGRLAAVRLQLSGRCEFHREIEKPQGRSEVIGEIRNLANQIDDLWLEKIELETAPPVDVEALRSGSDLFGELLRDFDQWRIADDADLPTLAEPLDTLAHRIGNTLPKSDLDLQSPEKLRHWLKQAEAIVLALAPTSDTES